MVGFGPLSTAHSVNHYTSLTTILFWHPRKYSKYMTTSMSVIIRILNDELTFNDLPFIGNWSCTDRRVFLCVADQTPKRMLFLSVGLRSSRHRIVRPIVRCTPCPCRGKTENSICHRRYSSGPAVVSCYNARRYSCAVWIVEWRERAVRCRTNRSNMRWKTWVGIGWLASAYLSLCEDRHWLWWCRRFER